QHKARVEEPAQTANEIVARRRMRRAMISVHGIDAGILEERTKGRDYTFSYHLAYAGPPVSLSLPRTTDPYHFNQFPPFLDGLLPEGVMLESLLRQRKIDRDDPFSQLLAVGHDLVGAITLREIE